MATRRKRLLLNCIDDLMSDTPQPGLVEETGARQGFWFSQQQHMHGYAYMAYRSFSVHRTAGHVYPDRSFLLQGWEALAKKDKARRQEKWLFSRFSLSKNCSQNLTQAIEKLERLEQNKLPTISLIILCHAIKCFQLTIHLHENGQRWVCGTFLFLPLPLMVL